MSTVLSATGHIRSILTASLLLCVAPTFSMPFDQARAATNGSVTYTYDALGRVASVIYDTGVTIIYQYDANGNRTQQTINVNGGPLCWSPGLSGTCTTNNWDMGIWN